MDDKTLNHFRELFLAMRNKHMQMNYNLENDFIWKNEDFDLKAKLSRNRDNYLKRLDMALERIDEGVFGKCIDCFNEIEKVKIFMKPTIMHCEDCAGKGECSDDKVVPFKRANTSFENNVIPFTRKQEMDSSF